MVSNVTVNTALQGQAETSAATVQIAEDFTQFLNLLTLQLQNQDPLNPTDTNEFTNQIVAFTGVEQQINTNQKLDSLISLGLSSSFPTNLNYVGLEASYISAETFFDGSTPIKINYTAPGSVDTTINIFDEAGELILSRKVSDDENVEEFVWNGETDNGTIAEAGTYEISVDAIDGQGNPIQTSTVVNGIVKGLETQNGALFLLVGERAVPISQVINVNEPSSVELETIQSIEDLLEQLLQGDDDQGTA